MANWGAISTLASRITQYVGLFSALLTPCPTLNLFIDFAFLPQFLIPISPCHFGHLGPSVGLLLLALGLLAPPNPHHFYSFLSLVF